MTTIAPIALELTVITMSDYFLEKMVDVIDGIDERDDFLVSQFDQDIHASLAFERATFHHASEMSEDYTGAYWEFAKAKTGNGFFIYPSSDKGYVIHNQNTYKHSAVDGRIIGLMASIMTFSHASFAFAEKHPEISQMFAEHYHALKNAFYGCVDRLAYNTDGDSDATKEQIVAIKEMSSIVTSYLD